MNPYEYDKTVPRRLQQNQPYEGISVTEQVRRPRPPVLQNQKPKPAARLPKAQALALASKFKQWLVVASLVGFGTFIRSMPQLAQARHRLSLLRRRRQQLHLLRIVITFSINKEGTTLAPAALRRHRSVGPASPKSAFSQYPTLMGMRHEDGTWKTGEPYPIQRMEEER